VVLSLVLFLALPLSVLLVVDHMRLQSQIKAEIKEMRKARAEAKAATEALRKPQQEE
jgi:hypothetical protein